MSLNKRLRLVEEKFQAGKKAFDAGQYQQAVACFLESAKLWENLKLKGKELNYAICLKSAATALETLALQQEVEQLRQHDIEQRIALEEAKKLGYLSYMATGVVHNINNPVGIIQLAAQRGLRKLKQGILFEEGEEIFQRILTQADRLHNIIQQFRTFANGDRNQREPVALNILVEQIKDYFEHQLEAHRIRLKLELSEQNPQSQTNRFVLQEVLMNLISNARDALEKTPDAFILIKTWQNTEKVGLQVEDNGDGIPPEIQKNLFSPFHSTKPHGTGLGLYFSYKAVADLGGTIEYQNRQPTGTCFIIELPPANGIII